jgi:hypothetical protein
MRKNKSEAKRLTVMGKCTEKRNGSSDRTRKVHKNKGALSCVEPLYTFNFKNNSHILYIPKVNK